MIESKPRQQTLIGNILPTKQEEKLFNAQLEVLAGIFTDKTPALNNLQTDNFVQKFKDLLEAETLEDVKNLGLNFTPQEKLSILSENSTIAPMTEEYNYAMAYYFKIVYGDKAYNSIFPNEKNTWADRYDDYAKDIVEHDLQRIKRQLDMRR